MSYFTVVKKEEAERITLVTRAVTHVHMPSHQCLPYDLCTEGVRSCSHKSLKPEVDWHRRFGDVHSEDETGVSLLRKQC